MLALVGVCQLLHLLLRIVWQAQQVALLQKPVRICGAQDVLQTFGAFAIFETRNKQRDVEPADRKEPPTSAESGIEEVSITPKIMASYESISVQSTTRRESQQQEAVRPAIISHESTDTTLDRDRDDGADSIVQDE